MPMPRVFLRETMIALRARRQAYRIATDFLYENPIDVETFECRSCGQPIRPSVVSATGWVRCGVCGVGNRVPPHLRTRQAPSARMVGDRDHWQEDWELWRVRRRMQTYLIIAFLILLIGLLLSQLLPKIAA
jgi:hypothetical protein